jgi:SSS family solute:Na+ symporter
MTTRSRITLTRILIVLIGLYILYWGLVYRGREDVWDYMAVTGSIYFTGAFALLFGGLYWKRASSTGAVAALLIAGVSVIGLEPVQRLITGSSTFAELAKERHCDLVTGPRISAWIGIGSVTLSVVAMVLFSLLFPGRKRHTEKEESRGERP